MGRSSVQLSGAADHGSRDARQCDSWWHNSWHAGTAYVVHVPRCRAAVMQQGHGKGQQQRGPPEELEGLRPSAKPIKLLEQGTDAGVVALGVAGHDGCRRGQLQTCTEQSRCAAEAAEGQYMFRHAVGFLQG